MPMQQNMMPMQQNMMPMYQNQMMPMQQNMMPMYQNQMMPMQPNMMPMQNQLFKNPIENPLIQRQKNSHNIEKIVNILDQESDEEGDVEVEKEVIEKNKKRKIDEKDAKGEKDEKNHVEKSTLHNSALNSLSNLFDNVLDNSRINKRQKIDVDFLPYKDGRNVVKSVNPLNLNDSHFNSKTYPEEKYYIQFLDGHNDTVPAKDINSFTLEAQKITSEHNKTIKNLYPNDLSNQINTAIYVRCSKVNDTSIETQKKACFEYALKNKMQVLPFGYLEDNGIPARNGKNFKTGELSVWLSHIPDNGNIIIYSPDRWSRHTLKGLQELDDLVKRNITIHFINNDIKYSKNTSSAHKSIIQSELMTAEKQSNDTSEKIKGTLSRLKTEGHVIGKAPYGFNNIIINGIRKRVINNEEQKDIKKIKDKFNDINDNFDNYLGIENIKKSKLSMIKFIMRWCSRTGMKNRNSKAFTISQIQSIIKSK
jgi:DNA invertase Pin-like site-specific DNA recombinase